VYLASNSAAKCYDTWSLKVIKAKKSTACVLLASCGQQDDWMQQKEDMHTGVSCASSTKKKDDPS